jgi:S-formylglutathione hydrolase FrmB
LRAELPVLYRAQILTYLIAATLGPAPGAVAAFSVGVVPRRISGASRPVTVRHYLAAGTLEPSFRRSTWEQAERLRRAGLPCRHEEWAGGHDQVWWQQQLPVALGWLLRA